MNQIKQNLIWFYDTYSIHLKYLLIIIFLVTYLSNQCENRMIAMWKDCMNRTELLNSFKETKGSNEYVKEYLENRFYNN